MPLIARIADCAPDLSLPFLWSGLRAGSLQLWLAGSSEDGHVAAQFTRLEEWDGVAAMRIIGTASDDSAAWFRLWPEFRLAAKAMGAARIVFDGRDGWARKIPQAKSLRTIYEVEIG